MSPNTARIRKARHALRTYSEAPGADEFADVETQIVDLVTDLLHLAALKHLDVEAILRTSKAHLLAEQDSGYTLEGKT